MSDRCTTWIELKVDICGMECIGIDFDVFSQLVYIWHYIWHALYEIEIQMSVPIIHDSFFLALLNIYIRFSVPVHRFLIYFMDLNLPKDSSSFFFSRLVIKSFFCAYVRSAIRWSCISSSGNSLLVWKSEIRV